MSLVETQAQSTHCPSPTGDSYGWRRSFSDCDKDGPHVNVKHSSFQCQTDAEADHWIVHYDYVAMRLINIRRRISTCVEL